MITFTIKILNYTMHDLQHLDDYILDDTDILDDYKLSYAFN